MGWVARVRLYFIQNLMFSIGGKKSFLRNFPTNKRHSNVHKELWLIQTINYFIIVFRHMPGCVHWIIRFEIDFPSSLPTKYLCPFCHSSRSTTSRMPNWLHFIFDTETGIWINLIGRRVFVWIEESLKILGILDFRKYYSQPKGAFNSTINVNCLYIYSFSKSWNFWKVHRYHQSIFKFTICRLDPFQSMFVTTQHNLRNSSRYFAEIYVWNVPFHDHTGFFISSAVNDVSTN